MRPNMGLVAAGPAATAVFVRFSLPFLLFLFLPFYPSASEMTYTVSGGALNSTHSLTHLLPFYPTEERRALYRFPSMVSVIFR